LNSATFSLISKARREGTVPIEVQSLKSERDRLKEGLRELETEQRKLEADLKALRQREIQAKREIEALTTLIDINESRDEKKQGAGP
jgi:septation ring formation regulator EzrA